MATDENQVRALTEFCTGDTDASRFCGLVLAPPLNK